MSDINSLPKAEGEEEVNKKETISNNLSEEQKFEESNETQQVEKSPQIAQETVTDNDESDNPIISDSNKDDEVLNEIEDSNAEDAEDEGNKDRHRIEL